MVLVLGSLAQSSEERRVRCEGWVHHRTAAHVGDERRPRDQGGGRHATTGGGAAARLLNYDRNIIRVILRGGLSLQAIDEQATKHKRRKRNWF